MQQQHYRKGNPKQRDEAEGKGPQRRSAAVILLEKRNDREYREEQQEYGWDDNGAPTAHKRDGCHRDNCHKGIDGRDDGGSDTCHFQKLESANDRDTHHQYKEGDDSFIIQQYTGHHRSDKENSGNRSQDQIFHTI